MMIFHRCGGSATAAVGRSVDVIMTVIIMGVPASTAAAAGGTSAATTLLRIADQDDLEADLLESELVTGTAKETERPLGWLVGGAEFDADRLAGEVREVLPHLPVENERDIGVELFLQLKELAVAEIPFSRLEHGQHEHVVTRVMRKGVEHPGPLQAGARRRRVSAGQIFPEGNHT